MRGDIALRCIIRLLAPWPTVFDDYEAAVFELSSKPACRTFKGPIQKLLQGRQGAVGLVNTIIQIPNTDGGVIPSGVTQNGTEIE